MTNQYPVLDANVCIMIENDIWTTYSIGGYPKGLTFGAPIGLRTPEGRDDFLAYYNSSISIPDPSLPREAQSVPLEQYSAIERIEAVAKEYKVFVVCGVIERDGGTLYCSVVWVHPDEGLIGKRRKVNRTRKPMYCTGY